MSIATRAEPHCTCGHPERMHRSATGHAYDCPAHVGRLYVPERYRPAPQPPKEKPTEVLIRKLGEARAVPAPPPPVDPSRLRVVIDDDGRVVQGPPRYTAWTAENTCPDLVPDLFDTLSPRADDLPEHDGQTVCVWEDPDSGYCWFTPGTGCVRHRVRVPLYHRLVPDEEDGVLLRDAWGRHMLAASVLKAARDKELGFGIREDAP